MANKFLTALFGDYSAKEVKRVKKTADRVLALESKYQPMSDKELTAQTDILKGRLANGETLDDILPDAFAVCREGAWRVLGMKHFPVQIIGGIILHQGRIAEMKTGEGKTLVSTLAGYLNALQNAMNNMNAYKGVATQANNPVAYVNAQQTGVDNIANKTNYELYQELMKQMQGA